MSLREKIYDAIKADGPLTDEAFELRFRAPRASVRRSRGELLRSRKIKPAGIKIGGLMAWAIAAETAQAPRPGDAF